MRIFTEKNHKEYTGTNPDSMVAIQDWVSKVKQCCI